MSARAKNVLLPAVVLGAVVACFWITHAAAPPALAEDAKKEKKRRPADREVRDKLDTVIDYAGIDEKQSLAQALMLVAKKENVRIEIDTRAFRAEGMNNATNESDGPEVASPERPISAGTYTLATVLQRITERVPVSCGARFVLRKGYIEITTENALRRELGLPLPKIDEDNPAPPPIPLVWEDFADEPLTDALRTLADVMDISILVDPAVATKAASRIDATLRNVPLDTALELLADMGGLVVVKRPGAYYVTSRENAEKLGKKK